MKNQLKSILLLAPMLFIFGCNSSSEENSTEPQLATVQTVVINNITSVSAISGGSISNDGNLPIIEKGICWNTSPNPTLANNFTSDGNGSSSFTSNLTSLTGNTTYYVRAYATNSIGTSYGNEVSFKSAAVVVVAPTVSTTVAINIKQVTADSGGNVTSDGGSAVSSRGICWNTVGNPTILDPKTLAGTGSGTFTASAISIMPNTTYFLRAFASNSAGTAYGTQISFTTQNLSIPGQGVTDIDGNKYTSVILGGKEWMVENLRTTKYRNGNLLTNVTSDWDFNTIGTGIWCYYTNNAAYNNTYGKLYDWNAATDSRQIAPLGWHVPSIGEWDALLAYLGGANSAGGKLKDYVSGNWIAPNTGADNSSGFKAMPGGYREGTISSLQGLNGLWWSTDQEGNGVYGRAKIISNNSIIVSEKFSFSIAKSRGLSIRCVKD